MEVFMHHDDKWMREALIEAQKALDLDILPVGAVLVKDNKIVARTHKTMSSNLLDHAEMNLLRMVMEGYVGGREAFTIYTTLEPCLMCYGTIRHCSLGRLVYAMEDPYGGAAAIPEQSLPNRHHTRPLNITAGVLREESRQLFKTYLSNTQEPFWANGGAADFQKLVMM